jgi:hypothetical protein
MRQEKFEGVFNERETPKSFRIISQSAHEMKKIFEPPLSDIGGLILLEHSKKVVILHSVPVV